MEAKDRIIVALDVNSIKKATALVEELSPYVGSFKIGLQLIHSILNSIIIPKKEEEAIENLKDIRKLFSSLKGKIFWDGKFSDIPNTVKGASEEVVKIGVEMFSIHACSGQAAIKAAVKNKGKSLLLGVTVLTSISDTECRSIYGSFSDSKVKQFALMLLDAGADAVICSPRELEALRDFNILKITPNVRPEWAVTEDQNLERAMTPYEAIMHGADCLIIGRPITNPPEEIGSPVEAVKLIIKEIEEAEKILMKNINN